MGLMCSILQNYCRTRSQYEIQVPPGLFTNSITLITSVSTKDNRLKDKRQPSVAIKRLCYAIHPHSIPLTLNRLSL